MKIDLLFGSFPFINGDHMTFSRVQDTDFETLSEILKENNLEFSPRSYIHGSDTAFKYKQYIELGFYKESDPNTLLGTVTIGNFDYELNIVSLQILYRKNESSLASLAIKDLCIYLFSKIGVRRIYCELKLPSDEIRSVFESADFVKEAELRECLMDESGEYGNSVVYAVLRRDYIHHITMKKTHSDDAIIPEAVSDY